MPTGIKNRGFGADHERARRVAIETRAKETFAVRSARGIKAVRARWDKAQRDGLEYEQPAKPDFNK